MKNIRYNGVEGLYSGLTAWLKENQEDNGETVDRLRRNLPRAIVEELTPLQAETIILHFYDGKSVCEIARERGVRLSTVYRTLERAQVRLKRCLKYSF